jgi:hypothetical protein
MQMHLQSSQESFLLKDERKDERYIQRDFYFVLFAVCQRLVSFFRFYDNYDNTVINSHPEWLDNTTESMFHLPRWKHSSYHRKFCKILLSVNKTHFFTLFVSKVMAFLHDIRALQSKTQRETSLISH